MKQRAHAFVALPFPLLRRPLRGLHPLRDLIVGEGFN